MPWSAATCRLVMELSLQVVNRVARACADQTRFCCLGPQFPRGNSSPSYGCGTSLPRPEGRGMSFAEYPQHLQTGRMQARLVVCGCRSAGPRRQGLWPWLSARKPCAVLGLERDGSYPSCVCEQDSDSMTEDSLDVVPGRKRRPRCACGVCQAHSRLQPPGTSFRAETDSARGLTGPSTGGRLASADYGKP